MLPYPDSPLFFAPKQCCGSGNTFFSYWVLGAQSSWQAVLLIRILRMFMGLLDPDPDPLVRGMDPDPSIIKQKIVRKTLIPTALRLLFDFLSSKNDVNVPSKSNKQKNYF